MYCASKNNVETKSGIRHLLIGFFLATLLLSSNYVHADVSLADFPLQQIKQGIVPSDVKCKSGLKLVFKATDGSPACVTVHTKDKLVQREWAESEGFGAILEDNANPSDDIELVPGFIGNSLTLTGKGYMTAKSISTAELSSLSISAWVKPDYSQGSSEFTVFSKESAFALSINNNIPPEKKATFSIFDGVSWTTAETHNDIPEQWTHLVVTFDGSTINFYVNGILDSTTDVSGTATLSESGQVTTKDIAIKSNSNFVIGAYLSTKNTEGMDIAKNFFSGQIDSLNFYDYPITDSQIDAIYNSEQSLSSQGASALSLQGSATQGLNTPRPTLSWQFESP